MRISPYVGLGLATVCLATQAHTQTTASRHVTSPPLASEVGLLGAECAKPAAKVTCDFTPAETRKYIVEVRSADCLDAKVTLTSGDTKLTPKKVGRKLTDYCQVATAKVALTAAAKVQIHAATTGKGQGADIWLAIRKG